MIKDNWYQKINENQIEQEAGMQENTLTALMVLSILGMNLKMIDIVSDQYKIPKQTIIEKITTNSPEIQQIQQIQNNNDEKSKRIIQKVQQDVREIQQQIRENNYQQIMVTNNTVNAIKQLEGATWDYVSPSGATGEMQMSSAAWEDVNKVSQKKYPFEQYKFNKQINEMFGKKYLSLLAQRLERHKGEWKSNPYFLLLVSYRGGYEFVRKSNFDEKIILERQPEYHDYAMRGMNLLGVK